MKSSLNEIISIQSHLYKLFLYKVSLPVTSMHSPRDNCIQMTYRHDFMWNDARILCQISYFYIKSSLPVTSMQLSLGECYTKSPLCAVISMWGHLCMQWFPLISCLYDAISKWSPFEIKSCLWVILHKIMSISHFHWIHVYMMPSLEEVNSI